MGPTQALWEVERALEPVVHSLEGPLIATLTAPHPQANLDRLLEHLEALLERGKGYPQPARLLFVMTGPDAEPDAPAGEHVQGGHRLCQQARVPEVRSRHHRCEFDSAGVCGKERQGRVALELLALWPTHNRMLPEVVCHTDAIQARFLGGPRDLGQCRAKAFRAARPVEAVEL